MNCSYMHNQRYFIDLVLILLLLDFWWFLESEMEPKKMLLSDSEADVQPCAGTHRAHCTHCFLTYLKVLG